MVVVVVVVVMVVVVVVVVVVGVFQPPADHVTKMVEAKLLGSRSCKTKLPISVQNNLVSVSWDNVFLFVRWLPHLVGHGTPGFVSSSRQII